MAVADPNSCSTGAEVHLIGDPTNASYADSLTFAVCEALGRLDIVINCAGFITRGSATEISDDDWILSVGVNVEAPFRNCRVSIPIMEAYGGGAIVKIVHHKLPV